MRSTNGATGAARVTTTRRLSADGADRLAAIRQAALDVAEERGYDAFAMQDVAEVAGVSRTTLYKHYPSKDHLLIDALRDVWPQELAAPAAGPSASKVRRYALDLFDFWVSRPLLLDAMVKATVNIDYAAWRSDENEPMYSVLYALLDDIPEERRDAVTMVLLNVTAGAFINWCQGMETQVAKTWLERCVAVVVGPAADEPAPASPALERGRRTVRRR